MKKNLIKIALLGVFAFLFSAGFVSCKDYDDEIDEIRKDIKDLQTKLNDLAGVVTDVTYNAETGKLSVTKNGNTTDLDLSKDLTTYELKSTTEGGSVVITLTANGSTVSTVTVPLGDGGFDPSQLTVKNGDVYYGDVKTDVSLPTQTNYVTFLKNDEGVIYGAELSDGDATAKFLISDALPLTSIVFEPQAYLGGIQAMRVLSLDYPRWTQLVTPENGGQTGEIWNAPFNRTDTTTISPNIVAYYHLNPASATKAQIKKLITISDDKEYVTRAAASNPIALDNYSVADGMLRVEFKVTSEFIKSIDSEDDLVTVLAIQAEIDHEAAQTTITSDYAAVYRSKLIDFRLALVDKPELGHSGTLNQRHLYGADATTENSGVANYVDLPPFNGDLSGYAQVAIDSPADYELPYKEKLDLKPLVTAHFREKLDKKTAPASAEKNKASSGIDVTDYGMVYRFTKSNYYQGGNNTPQNEFFDLEDGVVTSKVYGTTGEAAIGREPLVRVDLFDTVNNQVVNSGWIKILITNPTSPVDPQIIDFEEFVARCENLAFTTTVEHMNTKVYNAVHLDKISFHELYELKTVSGVAGTAATLKTGDYGTVVERRDGEATETNLLTWTITPAEMDRALTTNGGKLTATVVYEGTGREDLEITLIAQVYEPTSTMNNKRQSYWNGALTSIYINAEIPGERTNLDDFYAGINSTFGAVPAEGINRPTFEINPASAVTEYPKGYEWNWNNTNNIGYHFQFRTGYTGVEESDELLFDADGNLLGNVKYNISVDNSYVDRNATGAYQSYSYLLATRQDRTGTQVVATIDTYTGYLEYNNGLSTLTGFSVNQTPIISRQSVPNYMGTATVNYPANDYAKALLNRVMAATDETTMYTAPIETILYNECRDIKVTNGEFVATFYRPVNARAGEADRFIDSENIKSLNYVDLVELTDWREKVGASNLWATGNFYNTPLNVANTNGYSYNSYWHYYNVKRIYVDIAGITTDMDNGVLGDTPLTDRTTLLEIRNNSLNRDIANSNYLAQTAYNAVNYGYVDYVNNGAHITKQFTLRLPVMVEYQWGTFRTEIDVLFIP